MTENEKLRALLAEARETLLAQHDPQDNIAMTQRIDAALAEPVGECDLCAVSKAFHDVAVSQRDGNAYLLAEVERERDEARAEVERLKLRFDTEWQECHDGSEQACCKAHE